MFCQNYLQFNRQFGLALPFCSALPIQYTPTRRWSTDVWLLWTLLVCLCVWRGWSTVLGTCTGTWPVLKDRFSVLVVVLVEYWLQYNCAVWCWQVGRQHLHIISHYAATSSLHVWNCVRSRQHCAEGHCCLLPSQNIILLTALFPYGTVCLIMSFLLKLLIPSKTV